MPEIRFSHPVFILAILCFSITAHGEAEFEDFLLDLPPPPRSSIWLEYNSGLQDSQDMSLSLDLVLPSKHRLLLGAGQSNLSSGNGQYQIYSASGGFHTEYGKTFEIGLLYDYWGNSNDLWTHTFSLPLRLNTADWSFDLIPQTSRINLYRRSYPDNRKTLITTSSKGIEAGISYFGIAEWELLLTTSYYHYADDMTRLNQPIARLFISDLALAMSYGFPERRNAAEVAYNFPRTRVGFLQERTISAVDHSKLDISAIKIAYYFNDDFAMHLEGGYIRLDSGNDTSNYLKLSGQINF